jgi:Ala-tRNA(Pro) deacylase
MECRERLENYLRSEGVQFEELRHPVAYTAQEVAAVEHVSGRYVAKVVMAIASGKPVMLVLPANMRVDLDKARDSLGLADLRLATEQEFAGIFADCEVGAMPPMGNLYGVPVYVDKALTGDPEIVFQAGTHTDTIKVRYRDFERLACPEVRDIGRIP